MIPATDSATRLMPTNGSVGPATLEMHSTRTVPPTARSTVPYVLWKIGDQRLWIGPFDRAAFFWTLVIPIWLSAPIIAGFAWRHMPGPTVNVAAGALALVLAVASGWLFWKAVAFPGCEYGSNFSPALMAVPAGIVGLFLGGGIAAAGLVSRHGLRRYAPVPAIGLGLIATAAAFVVTFVVAVAAFSSPVCQRPPIG